jgi:hypothetical protein
MRNTPGQMENLSKSLKSALAAEMIRLEKILRTRFIRRSQDQLRSEAERLLDANEHVRLLEYVSDLDEYRLQRAFENRDYKSERADNYAIDRLFWPVTNERWNDELTRYHVLIDDRCHPKEKADL